MTKHWLKQDDRAELDLRLEEELEGTFPASDPLKITRSPVASHKAVKPTKHRDTGRRAVSR